MRTLVYAHSLTRILAKYSSFDSYAQHRRSTHALCTNCNTSAGLEGPVGSSYEDYSVTKHMKSGKHSGKASHDQVLLQATVWEAGQCLSLFQRCVKPYVYAVFFSYLVNRYPHGSFITLRIN